VAARAFVSGTATALMPLSRATIAAESAPRTGRTLPSSESSPRNIIRSSAFPKNCPWHPASPSAIGRSNADPSLRKSAGARLMVAPCPYGKSIPQFFSADFTRCRLSFTALSGNPTT
jgi:hypothetical protein